MSDDSITLHARSIDEALERRDSHTANQLLSLYRGASTKPEFVAALIARLLQAEARRATGAAS